MKTELDLCYDETRRETCLLDWYAPENGARAVFCYFHGGGLEAGDKRDGIVLARTLTDRGIALASANYRMYPDAQYPDFIEDAARAAAYVKRRADAPLFIGGSSAGGYLSMMLCFAPEYLRAQGLAPSDVAGYAHDAGQPTCHFNVLRERGLDTRRVIVDESAPLFHVGLHELSADMLFLVSDGDLQNRLEQTELMLSTMRHFGFDMSRITYKVMHGGHCHYTGQVNENGESVLGLMVAELVDRAEE